MKVNLYHFLIGAALVLGAGCKKAQSPSDALAPTKASYGGGSATGFPLSLTSQRLIAYDNGDNTGLTKLLSFDIVNNKVDLISVTTGGVISNVFAETTGFTLDDGDAPLNIAQGAASDNYNEVGGTHITAFDGTNSGHMNYLFVYVPGAGKCCILTTSSTPGIWHMVWPSTGTWASGFNGYDLGGATDKVLAYGIAGTQNKPDLIFYRAGNAIFWLFQNAGNGSTFNAVAKSSSGIAGYDLKGATDQIAVVGASPGGNTFEWDLIAYRPEYNYVWYITHSNGTANFAEAYGTHSGLNGFSLSSEQARIIPYDVSSSGTPVTFMGYIPGVTAASQEVQINFGIPSSPTVGLFTSTFGYALNDNPYGNTPGVGDKFVAFHNNQGLSTLACFENGPGGQAQIWQQNPPGLINSSGYYTYTQIY